MKEEFKEKATPVTDMLQAITLTQAGKSASEIQMLVEAAIVASKVEAAQTPRP